LLYSVYFERWGHKETVPSEALPVFSCLFQLKGTP